MDLFNAAACHSASLAQQCFDSLAPVLPEMLAACGPCLAPAPAALSPAPAGVTDTDKQLEAAAAAAAAQDAAAREFALDVWKQLLRKGRSSFPGSLHALLQTWLFPAADALATAAGGTGGCQDTLWPEGSQQTEQQQLLHSCRLRSRAAAMAAASIPLAWEVQAASKPLLCAGGPAVMLQQLTPHVATLLELMQAGTGLLGNGQQASAGIANDGGVVLLATWLLQSWVAALQHYHPEQQSQQQGSDLDLAARSAQQYQSAASILTALLPRMVSAVAALVAALAAGPTQIWPATEALPVRCVIKGLELSRALLACQPVAGAHAISTDGSSSSSSTDDLARSTGAAAGDPVGVTAAASGSCRQVAGDDEPTELCWQKLLVALGELFARCPTEPMSLAPRQLLQTGCQVLGDLLGHLPTPTPSPAAAAAGQGRLQQQQQRVVWQGLQRDLQVLHKDLVTRKLVRSTSRKDLLQAVADTLELLSKAGFGVGS